MATEIPGTVIASLAAKPDSLDLTEEEHAALAVLLAAGLGSGREPAEVEGFMPTAVELTSAAPFSSQLGRGEYSEIGLVDQKINVTFDGGGIAASDDWEARI
jgi:hypothetical protein